MLNLRICKRKAVCVSVAFCGVLSVSAFDRAHAQAGATNAGKILFLEAVAATKPAWDEATKSLGMAGRQNIEQFKPPAKASESAIAQALRNIPNDIIQKFSGPVICYGWAAGPGDDGVSPNITTWTQDRQDSFKQCYDIANKLKLTP